MIISVPMSDYHCPKLCSGHTGPHCPLARSTEILSGSNGKAKKKEEDSSGGQELRVPTCYRDIGEADFIVMSVRVPESVWVCTRWRIEGGRWRNVSGLIEGQSDREGQEVSPPARGEGPPIGGSVSGLGQGRRRRPSSQ